MIADEVMSGFGRTGKWFAVDHWNVVPDIMTMAKGLTSAYAPLGAVAMKPEIAAAFDERTFELGLTYTAHPVSLAAAVANINVMRQDKLVEHAAAMGPVLNRMLKDLGETHPSVGEVRSIGLFGIIELVRDRKTKEPLAPWNGSSPEMARSAQNLPGARPVRIHTLAHRVDHPAAADHRGATAGGLCGAGSGAGGDGQGGEIT